MLHELCLDGVRLAQPEGAAAHAGKRAAQGIGGDSDLRVGVGEVGARLAAVAAVGAHVVAQVRPAIEVAETAARPAAESWLPAGWRAGCWPG